MNRPCAPSPGKSVMNDRTLNSRAGRQTECASSALGTHPRLETGQETGEGLGLSCSYMLYTPVTNLTQGDNRRQLFWARCAFYLSVALLLISVLLALNITNLWGLIIRDLPPIPLISSNTPAGALAVQTLAALGSRALVVLPALLLAGFSSHRHSTLFRLREEYSHKEALAVSVQGFKEQAPTYQEPIAAAVFQELLQNPATSMNKVSSTSQPNGFIQKLIAPSIEKAFKNMFEQRDGALTNITKIGD